MRPKMRPSMHLNTWNHLSVFVRTLIAVLLVGAASTASLAASPTPESSITSVGALVPAEKARLAATRPEPEPECGWHEGFKASELDDTVETVAVFDDGSGEALFVGGWFSTADGVAANGIARWDGTSWSTLSGPLSAGMEHDSNPGQRTVLALALYDDGDGEALFAGGSFTSAGGVMVNHIAKWDGSNWSALDGPLGTGLNDFVYALAVYDDGSGEALYVGGNFTTAGGQTANHIARWDGKTWRALSHSGSDIATDGFVATLAVWDDGTGEGLYAGGLFATAGGVTANGIARWDGAGWSVLSGPAGTGIQLHDFDPGTAWTLAVYDDGTSEALYVGGWFNNAGGIDPAAGIAKWDGAEWSRVGSYGSGPDFSVYALAVYDDGTSSALYAGGDSDHIARWDGAGWSTQDGPTSTGEYHGRVLALAGYDDGSSQALYVGGDFVNAPGVAVSFIARMDGTEWSALDGDSGSGFNHNVMALAEYDDGSSQKLYAGGWFTRAGRARANFVAGWDGSRWSALDGPSGTGMDGIVKTLATFDEKLYAGGQFTTAGGVTVNHIARWDGSEWSPLADSSGIGVAMLSSGTPTVHSLAVYDDGRGEALYIGGRFDTSGGFITKNAARWDGTEWTEMGNLAYSAHALAVYDDGSGEALYAATSGGIFKWDGTFWYLVSGTAKANQDDGSDRSGGEHGPPQWYALAVYDDGNGEALYAGGEYGYLMKWNGIEWTYLPGCDWWEVIVALEVVDDGRGEALFAGGGFESIGGLAVNHIARWDGTEWSALAGASEIGVGGYVGAITGHDDGNGKALWAGGGFTSAGGLTSSRIATWSCTPGPSPRPRSGSTRLSLP